VKPKLKVITLAVEDLDRSLAFYRDGLGLPTKGIIGTEFEDGAVIFFDLKGGLILATWLAKSLAKDAGIGVTQNRVGAVSLGHNVGSKAEVDAVMEEAKKAGATIVKPAADTFYGGYAGYFQDPDGHLWEAVWNPAFEDDNED
jgi:catechol 2,3-dioxygenase-like lactoylglutathione lyase family enzyme